MITDNVFETHRRYASNPLEQADQAMQHLSEAEKQTLLHLDDGIADRIREITEEKDITDRALAREMDVSERTISQWKGTGQVSRKKIALLAAVMGVDLVWLLTGQDPSFGTRIETKDNVVKLSSHITEGPMAGRQMINHHVPVIEVVEIEKLVRKDPKNWRTMAKDWLTTLDRGSIVIPTFDNEPGTPSFALQCVTKWFEPHVSDGEMICFATDIVPMVGDFTCFVVKKPGTEYWTYTAGYWEPTNWRVNTFRSAESFAAITEFTLRTQKHSNSPRDVMFTKADNEFEYIGTLVYATGWKNWHSVRRHTGYEARSQEVHERRIYDNK